MTPWPHQQRGLDGIDAAIARGERRICLTSPTGGGKTLIVLKRLETGLRSSVYTDRRMLLSQLNDDLERHGFRFGMRAAGHEPRLLEDIQLCMVQSEHSRVSRGRQIHPSLQVLIDEAHKNSGDTMQGLVSKHMENVPEVAIIGITATPIGIGHFYDTLIVAGTNTELRRCGALVPAYHYGPDEPDTKWVGKVEVGEGECGIANAKRKEFAHRVFGSVVEHYHELNPEQRPAILFAPGVKESIWFAQELTARGISAAHIDGQNCWLDGEERTKDQALIDEIAERSKSGDIKIVCNRFVLREGINWPWLYHGIFATVFGSLTSYIQAGGRLLRAHPSLDSVVIQDHGGNWWRHGSLNSDREWKLEYTDKIIAGMREQRLREKQDPEPITCPQCHQVRASGPDCPACGFRYSTKARMVLQKNGTLREVKGDIFRKRRVLPTSESLKTEWASRVRAVQKSKKATVQSMTFAQLEASFARDHKFQYPPRDWPMMPVNDIDRYRRVKDVTELTK